VIYLHMSVGYRGSAVVIIEESRGKRRAVMIALVLEVCGGVCALSTIVFLAVVWVSKSMPDLEEELTENQLTSHRLADLDLGAMNDNATVVP
jgi:hypothetical protein